MPGLRVIEQGGPILWVLFGVMVLMWTLILERYWIHLRVRGRMEVELRETWLQSASLLPPQWAAHLRMMLTSRLQGALGARNAMIQTLIALCPLLGLLGTVTGMIGVFDTVAVLGTGNARAVADGVYRATLPTMAGMVAAISGLYFQHALARRTRQARQIFMDQLR